MKKAFSILMAAMFATAMIGCGSNNATEDNNTDAAEDNSSSTEVTTDALPAGMYGYTDEAEQGYDYALTVTNGDGVYTMMYGWSPNGYSEEEDVRYSGSYNYSAATNAGTIEFNQMTPVQQLNAGTGRFTYDPDKKTIAMTFKDKTVTLTLNHAC